jgi:hypothetical protein
VWKQGLKSPGWERRCPFLREPPDAVDLFSCMGDRKACGALTKTPPLSCAMRVLSSQTWFLWFDDGRFTEIEDRKMLTLKSSFHTKTSQDTWLQRIAWHPLVLNEEPTFEMLQLHQDSNLLEN